MAAVTEVEFLGLDHQPAGALGLLDLHLHVARAIAARAADLPQGLQGADPAFVAGAPGLDSGANPDLFLGQLLVELGVLPRFGLQDRLFALQVGRVVARPACEPAAVEFQNAGGHVDGARPDRA